MAFRKFTSRGRLGWVVTALGLTLTVSTAAVLTGAAAQADSDKRQDGKHKAELVLRADTMAGLPEAFTGDKSPIRGLNGGGLPWIIDEGEVRLFDDGTLEVEVEGLVLGREAPVPEALRGTNPVEQFRAVVSCLTVENGVAATVNVATDPFPASRDGDAEGEFRLDLPNPCIAPIVFVTSPTLGWFAATGFDR